jgi:Recombinase
MSENRVKRWRDAKRQSGLKGVLIWLPSEEELRLKDLALQWHCSPSAVVQQALAQLSPTKPQGNGNPTDMSLIRKLIREEWAAMQAIPEPVAVGVTVTPNEISAQFQAEHYQLDVTETVTDTVTVSELAEQATPDKAAIVARLRAMRAQGLSLQQMADQLNREGVPTQSGKGTWKKGTIGKFLGKDHKPYEK